MIYDDVEEHALDDTSLAVVKKVPLLILFFAKMKKTVLTKINSHMLRNTSA